MLLQFKILREFPFVRLLSIFILGILLGIYIPSNSILFICLVLSVIGLLLSFMLRSQLKASNLKLFSKLSSVSLEISLLCAAYLLATSFSETKHLSYFGNQVQNKQQVFLVKIIEEPLSKTKHLKLSVEVLGIVEEEKSISCCGKALIYLEKDSLASKLEFGDELLIKGIFNKIEAAKNPNEFDYQKFLSTKNIAYQCFVKSKEWRLQSNTKASNFIRTWILKQRKKIKNLLTSHIHDPQASAVAQAILIGDKSDLDQNTSSIYAQSGAMHVLAVSGLHVGIIYLILNYLLGFLDKHRFKVAKPFLLVVFIWSYALLTGLSPSVLRAATMFSMLILAKAQDRPSNIFNVLAASALLLISIKPFILLELGFQLSYLALLGILLFQEKIYHLLNFKNFLLDKIWQLSSVSIAAQLSTFPISIYYFNQFPNLFLVSNLLVIPAAMLIVYLGILFIVFSPLKLISTNLAFLLEKLIIFLNTSLQFLDNIPYAFSEKLYLSAFQCLLIYALILMLYIGIYLRHKKLIFAAFLWSICILVSFQIQDWQNQTQKKILIYNVYKKSAIEIIDGKIAYTLFEESLKTDSGLIHQKIAKNWLVNGISTQVNIDMHKQVQLLEFSKHTMLIVDSNFIYPSKSIIVDYLVLKHQKKLDLKKFCKYFSANKYLFDTSNATKSIKYWKKDCESLNLDCYFVSDGMAYIENID